MDDDTIDLIQKLCTRAGMIMEDASVDALKIEKDDYAILFRLERLMKAASAVMSFTATAFLLVYFNNKKNSFINDDEHE